MEKVSIIIPLYNKKEYVSDAIESALNQSYKNIEIIVVNDGSNDKPEEVLKNYEESINVYSQSNKGPSSARNLGLKLATGEYIQFLDADDLLHKDKISLQKNAMSKEGVRVSYCEIAQFNSLADLEYLNYVGSVDDMFSRLFNIWFVYPLPIHSLLIRKDVFDDYGNFDEDLKINEDRYFFSILALNKETFFYFPFIGGVRRLHSLNITKDKPKMYENMIYFYEKICLNEIAKKYEKNNYDISLEELFVANISYMYLKDIESITPSKILIKIRSVIRTQNIKLNYCNIPHPDIPFKIFSLRALSQLCRWLNVMKKTLHLYP